MPNQTYIGWTSRDTTKKGYADLDTRFSSYNTKAEGLVGDSVADDRAALNTLVNVTMQPNGGTLDVVGVPRIASNLTIPGNVKVRFLSGAYFAPDVGITLTIAGAFDRSAAKKFGGGGLISFAGNTTIKDVYPQWWGATGDGVTADTASLLSAIAAAATMVVNVSAVGATVFLPPGMYAYSTQLVVPPGVRIAGAGRKSSFLRYTGVADFAVKLGNNAATLSYGTGMSDLGLILANTGASGVWLYGVADCDLERVYIEGVPGTVSSIGVQIDGANISAFLIGLKQVHCNHVWKGFVHTTTGTVQPTQVTAIGCTALCDNTVGSIGIDVHVVGGVGCGDGVIYIGGDVEACKIGVNLAGGGTTILGMRFENPQGTSSDVTFAATARNNQIIGGADCFTITDIAGSRTNQVIGVPKDETNIISQLNKLDATQISGGLTLVNGNQTLGTYDYRSETPSIALAASTVTAIFTGNRGSANFFSALLLVSGVNNGATAWFSDVVHVVGNTIVAVLSSQGNGAPAARTYSVAGNVLSLSMPTAQASVRVAGMAETNALP